MIEGLRNSGIVDIGRSLFSIVEQNGRPWRPELLIPRVGVLGKITVLRFKFPKKALIYLRYVKKTLPAYKRHNTFIVCRPLSDRNRQCSVRNE